MTRNIGLSAAIPKNECTDSLCPFHGTLNVRGKVFEGRVLRAKASKMIVIEREPPKFITKFKRYARSKSKIHAYLPSCVGAKEGDLVMAVECRPISKTISFVVIEVKS